MIMNMVPVLRRMMMNDTLVINASDVLENSFIYIPTTTSTYTFTSTTCNDSIRCTPYHHDIVYIHKTNCPNCGGLLDGDEHSPYVKCACCGAKIWSEREVL